jgi:hypothetical protein
LPIDPRGGAMTERLARFVLLQGKQIVCRGPAILATRCPHSALRRQGKAVAKHLE